MGRRSLDGRLDELERRLRDQPPARLDFCTPDEVLFSVGDGTPHRVDVTSAQAPFMRWLHAHRDADLSGVPIVLLGDNRMGQDDAGRLAAVFLAAVRGARVRIYTEGPHDHIGIYESLNRAMAPAWRDAGDRDADHFKVLRGEVDLVSIRARQPWSACDVAVIDFYSSEKGRMEEALETAPVRIVCGDQPEAEDEADDARLLALRDAAHAAERLFRFRREGADDVEKLVNTINRDRKWIIAEFWRPTGL